METQKSGSDTMDSVIYEDDPMSKVFERAGGHGTGVDLPIV
jgi:hypothetical protein